MHETLPCYLVLQVGAKLAKRIKDHLRGARDFLYSLQSALWLAKPPREQINRTFQFRKCSGKFFLSFYVFMEITIGQFGQEKAVTHKNVFAVGKRYLSLGIRAVWLFVKYAWLF